MTALRLAALLALVAAPALADPRHGRWTCTYGGVDFGTFRTDGFGYRFASRYAGAPSSQGGLRWESDSFWLTGGALVGAGVTSGALYPLPDQPEVFGLDLYSDLGVVARCRR